MACTKKNLWFLLFFFFSSQSYAYKRVDLHIESDLKGLEKKTNKKFTFEKASLTLNGKKSPITLKTRGQNCLRVERKCFSVSLKSPLSGLPLKFKLASLAQDHAYSHYILGLLFMEKINLIHIKYEFVHLTINGYSNGLYLLLEDPKTVLKEKGSVFIGRRRRWLKKPEAKFHSKAAYYKEKTYLKAYKDIREEGKKYTGKEKYDFLQENMDLDSYFDWLAVNSLIQNGDYDDELFFYAKNRADGKIYFEFMGWDYEDIFAKPHFVNKIRHPLSIRKTLLYSLVEKLDYDIYRDEYVYGKFVEHMRKLIKQKFSILQMRSIFLKAHELMKPFLNPEVLNDSIRDDQENTPYTRIYIKRELQSYYDLVIKRSNTLLRQSYLPLFLTPNFL